MKNDLLCKTYSVLKKSQDPSQEVSQLLLEIHESIISSIWHSFVWKGHGCFTVKTEDVQGAYSALREAVGEDSYKDVCQGLITDVKDPYNYVGKFEFESKDSVGDFLIELNKRNINLQNFFFTDGREF